MTAINYKDENMYNLSYLLVKIIKDFLKYERHITKQSRKKLTINYIRIALIASEEVYNFRKILFETLGALYKDDEFKKMIEDILFDYHIYPSDEDTNRIFKKDLETLKDYLTPQLLDAWQTKMNWYEFQGRRNELTNIKLIKQHIVNVYDSENDDEDYFWVYIEGMMDDLTIDEQNQVIESYDGVFVEYWKFKRLGNRILLDEIRQQDEYEN